MTQQKTKDLFAPQLFFLGEIDETFELLHLLGKTVGPPIFVTVFVDIENQMIFTDLSLPLHLYILLSTISWWIHYMTSFFSNINIYFRTISNQVFF